MLLGLVWGLVHWKNQQHVDSCRHQVQHPMNHVVSVHKHHMKYFTNSVNMFESLVSTSFDCFDLVLWSRHFFFPQSGPDLLLNIFGMTKSSILRLQKWSSTSNWGIELVETNETKVFLKLKIFPLSWRAGWASPLILFRLLTDKVTFFPTLKIMQYISSLDRQGWVEDHQWHEHSFFFNLNLQWHSCS